VQTRCVNSPKPCRSLRNVTVRAFTNRFTVISSFFTEYVHFINIGNINSVFFTLNYFSVTCVGERGKPGYHYGQDEAGFK